MGGQELAGGGYEQASVRTTVWEAASSLLGRAVETPAHVLREKVLRTYRDKKGDVRISRVRALRGRTLLGTQFRVWGRAPRQHWLFLVSCQTSGCQQFWGGHCDEGENITKQPLVSGTIVSTFMFYLISSSPTL